jgi:hypothetical protein
MRVNDKDFAINMADDDIRAIEDENGVDTACRNQADLLLAEFVTEVSRLEKKRVTILHLLLAAGDNIPERLLFPVYSRSEGSDPRQAVAALIRSQGIVVAEQATATAASNEVDAFIANANRLGRAAKRRRLSRELDEVGFSDTEDPVDAADFQTRREACCAAIRSLVGSGSITMEDLLGEAIQSKNPPNPNMRL